MALTEETLKMARISGLGYAEATDYMTNAVRSFKMEMTDAQRVVDVYSEIAASSATSTTELATAMSKTASSAEAVGSSFENTTAMMAVMIEATRESATNIGSAMKSIISRYGEMTSDPSKLMDSEGEEMSLNKVDKALQSVGITIQDANHQFREFDDVIAELAGKWDTIDNNTQRYIATVMAGNRQQSRFLALVSNGERLAELSEKAANAEDAATLQVLKTMDSIEAKTQQLQTSLQSLYTSTGVQNFFKGILDVGNGIINTFTRMPTTFNLPILAISKFGSQFYTLASVVKNAFALMKTSINKSIQEDTLLLKQAAGEQLSEAEQNALQRILIERKKQNGILEEQRKGQQQILNNLKEGNEEQIAEAESAAKRQQEAAEKAYNRRQAMMKGGMAASAAGLALSTVAGYIDIDQYRKQKSGLTGASAFLQGVGTYLTTGNVAMGALTALPGIIEAIGMYSESTTERIDRLNNAIKETSNKKLQSKDDLKTLTDYKNKYDELYKTRNRDAESKEEWKKLNNEIAASYPELIAQMDVEGNYLVDMTSAYEQLANAKQKVYKEDFLNNIQAELNGLSDINYVLNKIYNLEDVFKGNNGVVETLNRLSGAVGGGKDNLNKLPEILANNIQDLTAMREKINSIMNYSTAQDLFNINFDSKGVTYTNMTTPMEALFGLEGQKTNIRLSDEGQEVYSRILSQFIEMAEKGLSFVEAKGQLKSQEGLQEYTEAIDSFDDTLYSNLVTATSAAKFQKDLINNKINAANDEWINYLQNLTDGILPDTGKLQKTAINKELDKQWEEYFNNLSEEDTLVFDEDIGDYRKKTYGEIYKDFLDNVNEEWYRTTQEHFNYLNSKELDEIYSQLGKYTSSELKNLDLSNFGEKEQEVRDTLLNYFIQQYSNIVYDFYNNMKNLGLGQEANKIIPQVPPEFLESIEILYSSIFNNEALTNGQKEIQKNVVSNIVSSIANVTDQTKRNGGFLALQNADLTSLTGINNFIKALEDLGYTTSDIDFSDLINNIIPNFVTEYGSLETNLTSNLSDLEKALNNAANGMDSKTALEMAGKLGLTLHDFEFKNGKYFYDNYQKIISSYGQIDEDLIELINGSYNDTINLIDSLKSLEEGPSKMIKNASYTNDKGEKVNFGALNESDQLAIFQQRTGIQDQQKLNQLLNYYNQYYNDFIKVANEYDNNFWNYVEEQIKQSKENVDEIFDNIDYITDVNNLKLGNFGIFLSNQNLDKETRGRASQAFTNSDLDTLLEIFPEYSATLIGIFENLSQNIYNNILNGITSGGYITSTEQTDAFYKKYAFGPNRILEEIAPNTYKFIGDSYQVIIDDIKADETLTDEQKNNLLKTIHTNQFKDNVYTALNNVIDKYNSFSYEAGQALATALGGDDVDALIKQGIITEDTAGNLSTSYEQMRDYLNSNIQNMSTKQYNDLRAKLEAANYKQSDEAIFANIIKNRESLSAENIEELANILGTTYNAAKSLLKDNGNGTYTLDLAQIQNIINWGRVEVTDETKELLASDIDDVVSSITNIIENQPKGFTNLADMQKYVEDINKTLPNANYNFQDIFEYNDILHAYQLSTTGLVAQIQMMKEQIASITEGENAILDEEYAEQLKRDVIRGFAEQIDISGYLNLDDNDPEKARKLQEVISAIDAYNNAVEELGTGTVLYADTIVEDLEKGGEKAIGAARKVAEAAGDTLSPEEIESAYNSDIASLEAAFDQLSFGVGAIVSGEAKSILETIDTFDLHDLGDGTAVIETIGDVTEAYRTYYKRLKDTNVATVASLNEAMAKILEKEDDADVISALGDAANMTYTRLGEILASKGKELTNDFIKQYQDVFESIGGGKLRIINFEKFATEIMEWTDIDVNSEEYVSAFKTYNDSLIELNRKTEKTIADEIHSIGDAKAGDQINLTQLSVELGEIASNALAKKLENYGAYLSEGILTLSNNANIPAIIQEITQEAANKDLLLEDTMAELADTLNEVLENYTNLISGGIEGKLTNAQAQQLQTQAKSYGFNDELDFKKTADGLKLSETSARNLYLHLKQVDGLRANLVFNKLDESLKKSNEHYKNIFTITSRIAELNKEINNPKISTARRDEYKKELEVAKEIKETRSLTDPNTFNFMDQDLPDSLKGADNFWKSARKAYVSMNQAGENGYMAFQDWYNLAHFIEDSAITAGTTIEFAGQQIGEGASTAADLIERGAQALANVDDEGSVVSFKRLGTSFKNGAQDMSSDFDVAIKTTAKAQIKMLDALISMLELVVAMENLDEISGPDKKLDFTELFPFYTDDSNNFNLSAKGKASLQTILDSAKINKDLANALDTFMINGKSMRQCMQDAINGNIKDKNTADLFWATLAGLQEALQSGDYSPENIKQVTIANLQKTLDTHQWAEYTLTDGTRVQITSNGYIEQTKDGKWTINGGTHTYKTAAEAQKGYEFLQKAGIEGVFEDGELTGTIELTKDSKIKVTENNEGEIVYTVDGVIAKDKTDAMKKAILKARGEDPAGSESYNVTEGDIIEYNMIAKFNLTGTEVANLTGKPIGQLTDKILTDLGIDIALVNSIEAGVERALTNINLGQLILDGLLKPSDSNAIAFNADEIGTNPQLVEVGRQLGLGISKSIKGGVNSGLNGEDGTEGLGSTVASSLQSGETDVQGAAENVAGKVAIPFKNLIDPGSGDGFKIWGMTAIQQFVDGFNIKDSSGNSNFSQILGGDLLSSLKSMLTGGTMTEIGKESINSFTNGFAPAGDSSITNKIVAPIYKALQNLFAKETLDQLCQDFKTNSTIELSFNSINVGKLTEATNAVENAIESLSSKFDNLKGKMDNIPDKSSEVGNTATAMDKLQDKSVEVDNTAIAIDKLHDKSTEVNNTALSIDNLHDKSREIGNTAIEIDNLHDKSTEVNNTASAIDNLHDKSRAVGNTGYAIDRLHDRSINLHGNLSLSAYVYSNGAISLSAYAGPLNASFAKGTNAKQKNNFKGGNKTLVGELGPELVVSNGRYYVVGQNGAEMVDLPDDAIVFNHLQTKRLLGNGKGGRGKPVTNEKNAVSYATGNVSGPALASASSVLAALKELRAMWESMLTASAKQLGSQAGKSKDKTKTGSSKGDNGDGTTTADDGTRIKTTTAEIQRWYNLLRQIAKTEKDITYEEKLQTQYQSLRVADGKSLYKSYKAELSMLDDQVARSQELAELQKSWYDTKRAELAASAYGKIFTYTEDGLQQYVSGANKGLDILEKLTEADIWGNPTGYAKTAATQLNYLQSLGFDLSELLSNSDGTKVAGRFVGINTIYDEDGKLLEGQDLINAQVAIMENFWDNIDGWRDELDGLYDSYREQLSSVVDNQNKQNEIMQKIVDNQIEVENKIYDALVDARQAIIDNAQKEMDAYQKNADEMIDSLNKTLDKERQLYDNQKNSNDLLKLQRQLAILQRSGGSTSQILSLQQQIATKQQDMYFDEKEEQIKALQEASDLQLEKMQEQINLMTETLEYQKKNGLLWEEVYAVMEKTPEEILDFISKNSSDWASNSALQISQTIADLKTKIELYTNSRDDNFMSYYNDISSSIKTIADATSRISSKIDPTSPTPDIHVPDIVSPTKTGSGSSSSGSSSSSSSFSSFDDTPSRSSTPSYNTPDDSNNSLTARLTEGSTTVYKKSGGKFILAHQSMGKTGAEVTILKENAGYYGNKQISKVEYKGKKYYIRNERLAYKKGGLIDFTGLAWVDGSPSEPEAILNANETKFVQNKLPNILNSVDTLQERLKDLQALRADWLSSISHVVDNSNNQNSSVNIEHVELNMNVEQMSSSADAKKLGREAFDELLNMARKAGKNSVSRR